MKNIIIRLLTTFILLGGVVGANILQPIQTKAIDLGITVFAALPVATPIDQVFPDAGLASKIATSLGKATTDTVTQSDLDTITFLSVGYSGIANLTGLEYLTNLNYFSDNASNVTDISQLAGLTQLTTVSLSSNALNDITPLAGLVNLTSLNLFNNQIADISVLGNLSQLTDLRINNNQITNIAVISNLTNLKTLYVNSNTIADLSSLTTLSNLETLSAADNDISDITPLSGLTTISNLYLQGNNITTLEALNSLTNIQNVSVANQSITLPVAEITNPFSLTNMVKDTTGTFITPSFMSNAATYDTNTHTITWIGLTVETAVNYEFDESVMINGIATDFYGTIVQPLQDTMIPVIIAHSEVIYSMPTTRTEAEFLADIAAITNDGSTITSNFDTVVNFAVAGDYTVTLNATDANGNQATPVQVVVHILAATTNNNTSDNNSEWLPVTGNGTGELLALGGLLTLISAGFFLRRKK